MTRDTRGQQTTIVHLLLALVVGLLGVMISLWAYKSLMGPQATHAAALRRMADFIYWTQPFIYLAAGLIAGRGDPKGGPMRAPVIGLFLAAAGYLLVRRLGLLPPDSSIPGYMITAGALFGLVGAVLATLLGDHTGSAVWVLVGVGLIAYVAAYFGLASVAGRVQHEVIERAQGMTIAMKTEPVPDVPLSLLELDTRIELYSTRTNRGGRYLFSKVPPGDYLLRAEHGYGRDRAVIEMRVQAARTITGDTPWATLVLPAVVREAGRIFE